MTDREAPMDPNRDHPLGSLLVEHPAPTGLITRAMARQRARRRWVGPTLALACAAAGFILGLAFPRQSPPVVTALDLPEGRVPVRLVFSGPDAEQVAVAATWNDWRTDQQFLSRVGEGLFATTVYLERDQHEYMFVVDGTRWVTDRTAAAWRDDGFGNRNAVIEL